MLHILLIVLKILGFTILGILGLILALLLLILFVPIRYRVSGFSKEEYEISAVVSWLLHILHISAEFDTEKVIRTRVRIFGLPLLKKDIDLFGKRKQESEKEAYEEEELLNLLETEEAETIFDEEVPVESKEPVPDQNPIVSEKKEKIFVESEKSTDSKESENVVIKTEATSEKTKKEGRRKFDSSKSKSSDKTSEDKSSLKKSSLKNKTSPKDALYAKLEPIKEKVEEFSTFIQAPPFGRAFSKLKKALIRILKSILPRQAKAHITYGFDDPEKTGRTLGILSMINAHIPATVILTPDFEKTILYGDGYFKGHIRLIAIIVPAIGILLNKDIRYCIKKFKQLK